MKFPEKVMVTISQSNVINNSNVIILIVYIYIYYLTITLRRQTNVRITRIVIRKKHDSYFI